MSKALMMIDEPADCGSCPCASGNPFDYDLLCKATGDVIQPGKPRLDNCPLIPVNMQQMDIILSSLKKHSERIRL